jgi:hypothetical protein
METIASFKIVLEKGKAEKPYNKMNEQEREEVSIKVWEKVKHKATLVGQKPVVLHSTATSTK